MIELSAYELGWWIGFFEGEGSICWVDRKGKSGSVLALNVAQKDREPLEHVVRLFGGKIYTAGSRAFQVNYYSARAYEIAMYSMPHLSARRQAQIRKATDSYLARRRNGDRFRGRRTSPDQLRLLG